MKEELAERIAVALERQVQQHDEQVQRNEQMREENLQMRQENIHRDQSREYAADSVNLEFLKRLDQALALIRETNRRVLALEEAQTINAVDPAAAQSHDLTTRA